MDYSLRCNSLKCRTRLEERAVVTTCSHIFCLPCSESFGLANANSNARVCPACETQLSNPDDAVVTMLNPSEDYKTSVLSGLSPTVIMECAGRALSFYSYQTAQEIIYQEFLARSLTDKYSNLSTQMDKIIHDANSEIVSLRDKLSAMHIEQKNLEQKNYELSNDIRLKSKNHEQISKMYQSLKRQQLAPGLELAAEHDAEYVLHAANNGSQRTGQGMHSRGSGGSRGSVGHSRTIQAWEQQGRGAHSGIQPSHSVPSGAVPSTPSGMRHRMPNIYANNGDAFKQTIERETYQNGTPRHNAINSQDHIGLRNSTGYGMSAGMRMGRQQQGPIGRPGFMR